MGKSNPPTTPDYVGGAQAQSQASAQNIEQQTWANRVNQYTPFGSTTYQASPTWDPSTGQWINQWTQNTSLAAPLQAAANSQMNIQAGRSAMGEALLQGAGEQLLQGGTPWGSNVPQAGGGLVGNQIQSGFGNAGPAMPMGGPSVPGLQTGVGGGGPLARTAGGVGNYASSAGTTPIQNTIGGTQQAVNYGQNLGNAAQGVQRGLSQQQALGPQQWQMQNTIQDPNAIRNNAENALYMRQTSRLDPMWQQRQDQQRTQLYNMGLREGDAAYQTQMDNLSRQRNDAYSSAMLDAINQGGNEASRQFGMQLGQGQFLQGLNAQEYGQLMGQAGLYNQANQAAGNFANQAQQQAYQQQFANAGFANQAQQQEYAQQMGQAGLFNQANQQAFGMNMANAQLQNQAASSTFANQLSNAQLQNAAAGQEFGQNLAAGQFANQALQSQYGMGMQNAQLQAALNQQGFNQGAQQAAFANQATAQDLQQQQQISAYQNQLRQQAINEALMAQGWNINLINGATAGQQVNMPQFGNFAQAGVAPAPNYLGALGMQYQGNMDAFNINQAQNASLMGGAMNLGNAAMSVLPFAFSDYRLKDDIILYPEFEMLPGVPLASWTWKGQPKLRVFGVIAQMLEKVAPEYVITLPSGLKMVDYSFMREV